MTLLEKVSFTPILGISRYAASGSEICTIAETLSKLLVVYNLVHFRTKQNSATTFLWQYNKHDLTFDQTSNKAMCTCWPAPDIWSLQAPRV